MPDGTIRTGARRDRVLAIFEPVLSDAVALLGAREASLYVYGSVVTGSARPGSSDADLLSVGLQDAPIIGGRLSALYADRCRGAEVAAASAADYVGDKEVAIRSALGCHKAERMPRWIRIDAVADPLPAMSRTSV